MNLQAMIGVVGSVAQTFKDGEFSSRPFLLKVVNIMLRQFSDKDDIEPFD